MGSGSDAQSYLIVHDPMDCSLLVLCVHEILQAGILERGCHFIHQGTFTTWDQTHVCYISCVDRQILYHCATWEAHGWKGC